jgi:hypothetical protein
MALVRILAALHDAEGNVAVPGLFQCFTGHQLPLRVSVYEQLQSHRQRRLRYQHREFSHRWLVSGHFRNQWYSSEQTHKVIWIAPHVKGPKGALFLPRVYRVSR